MFLNIFFSRTFFKKSSGKVYGSLSVLPVPVPHTKLVALEALLAEIRSDPTLWDRIRTCRSGSGPFGSDPGLLLSDPDLSGRIRTFRSDPDLSGRIRTFLVVSRPFSLDPDFTNRIRTFLFGYGFDSMLTGSTKCKNYGTIFHTRYLHDL